MSSRLAIPKHLWASVAVLVLLSGVIANVMSPQPLVLSKTSHGGPPGAWGAVYDVLDELHLAPSRSRVPLAERSPAQTQWIIEPQWGAEDTRHKVAEIERFAVAGGRVVLIGAAPSTWKALGFVQLTLPDAKADPKVERVERTDAKQADVTDRKRAASAPEPQTMLMIGAWLPKSRKLEVAERATLFDAKAADAGSVRVSTAAGAFVIERSVGKNKGKIVAVADSTFLTNGALAQVDDAAFVMDLVRAYGVPSFDDHCHGLVASHSPWAVLGLELLLLLALSLGALTLAAIEHSRQWPVPARLEEAPSAPTLEVFTGSLANLYRSRGSLAPAAVFRAYRTGYLRRLQRVSAPHGEGSQARLLERLSDDAYRLGLDGRWLEPAALPRSTAELVRAVATLERLGSDTDRRKSTAWTSKR